MSFTNTIKEYILTQCHMDAVGIAPASALNDLPPRKRPKDILPAAQSIIVFYRRIPDGVIQAAFRNKEDGVKDSFSIYAAYGNELTPNMTMFFMQFNIAQYIERNFGYTAVPIPSGPMQNVVSSNKPMPTFVGAKRIDGVLNPELAAVAAGLGEIGWNNRFVTLENGPRQRLGVVLTTMPLEYDTPYLGQRICNPQECHICSKICPVRAISNYGEQSDKISIMGKTCEMACLNTNACAIASLGLRKEFSADPKAADLVSSDKPTDEDIAEAYEKKKLSHYSLDHYPKYYCDLCLLYCPLGKWKEKYKDSGYSSFDEEKI